LVALRPTGQLHDVTLPVDGKIPFRSRSLRAYAQFYFPLIAFCGFLYHTQGASSLADIEEFLLQLAQLYVDAGAVFQRTQTSFKRSGAGFYVSLLRQLHKEKNSAPSVHVVVAA